MSTEPPPQVDVKSDLSETRLEAATSSSHGEMAHGTIIRCIPRSSELSLAVAIFYGTCSMSLSLVNKAVLSSYKFECYFLLLSVQMIFTLTFCLVSRDLFGNPFKVPALSRELWLKALPMGALGVGNVGAGLIGLRMVNVPMFFCLRKLVTTCVLVYEFLVFGKVTDQATVLAVLTVTLGTVMAGWETLSSHLLGYLITMVNNILSAATQVAAHRFKDASQCSTFGIVFMNAAVGLPLTLTLALVTGEFSTAWTFPALANPGFLAGFAASSCMGTLLTYSSILSTTYNSPLATSVTGNVKDIFITAVGWVLFGGMEVTLLSILGLCTSFAGAFAYSYISVSKTMAAQALKARGGVDKPPLPASAIAVEAPKSEPAASSGESGNEGHAQPVLGVSADAGSTLQRQR